MPPIVRCLCPPQSRMLGAPEGPGGTQDGTLTTKSEAGESRDPTLRSLILVGVLTSPSSVSDCRPPDSPSSSLLSPSGPVSWFSLTEAGRENSAEGLEMARWPHECHPESQPCPATAERLPHTPKTAPGGMKQPGPGLVLMGAGFKSQNEAVGYVTLSKSHSRSGPQFL